MYHDAPLPFGDVLRALRMRAGLSQEELAERAHLSSEAVGAMERGRRKRPYRETIERLADALQLEAGDRAILWKARDRANQHKPLRRSDAPAAEPTPLIGRDDACVELLSLVAEHRYVVLAGPASVGKSRLALEVALRWNAVEGRALFVELADAGEARAIADAVADAAHVERGDEVAVARSLRGERTLLVLDRCGRVAAASARFAATVLRETENVRVVATTRFVVPGHGEIVYRVEPLDPAAARALFAERARAADAHFVLSQEHAADVDAICERLDGLPYAIELAASSLPVLGVGGLRERLECGLALLDDPHVAARTRRGETFSATLDWSYAMLDDQERRLFARLAVFPDSWSLDAMEKVCGNGEAMAIAPALAGETLATLTALIDKSLVAVELADGNYRHRLLHTTHAYALRKLVESGEREMLRAQHARFYAEFCRDREDQWWRTPTGVWMANVRRELSNVRAMLDWAIVEGNDANAGARALAAIVEMQREGDASADLSAHVRALLLHADRLDAFARGCAYLVRNFPMPQSAELGREAVAFWHERGDVRRTYMATWCQYYFHAHHGERKAASQDARSLTTLADVIDSDKARALAALLTSAAAIGTGDLAHARDAALTAFRCARLANDDVVLEYALAVLADIERNARNHPSSEIPADG